MNNCRATKIFRWAIVIATLPLVVGVPYAIAWALRPTEWLVPERFGRLSGYNSEIDGLACPRPRIHHGPPLSVIEVLGGQA